MYFWSIFTLHDNSLMVRKLGWINEPPRWPGPGSRAEEERKLKDGFRFCYNISNNVPWLEYNTETEEAIDVWEWYSDGKVWLTFKMAEGAGLRAQRKQNQYEKACARGYHSKKKRIRMKYQKANKRNTRAW